MNRSRMKSSAVPLAIVLAGFCIQGCAANGYSQFFTSTMPAPAQASKFLVPAVGEPDLRYGNDPKSDYVDMVENGYQLIGYSNFWGPPQSREAAMAAARAVHAAVIVIYSTNSRSVTQTTPVVDLSFVQDVLNPKTETTRTSGTVSGDGGSLNYSETSTKTIPPASRPPQMVTTTSTVSDQFASFWVMGKTPRLGLLPRDLTADERSARGSNRGIAVVAVIKGSPAFAADIMRGDILTQVGDLTMTQSSDFQTALDRYAGSDVALMISRGGADRTIRVHMNPNPQ